MAPLSTSENIQPVRAAHRFDENTLLRYLQRTVIQFPQHSQTSLKVGQFGHGQSNPTFLLDVRGPTGEEGRFVLRKKPPGKLLKSAHAVDREYQVLKALNGTAVPVPKVICLCTDPSIIGTAFYVMEHIEGRIFLDPALPEVPPQVRYEMYEEMARTLAAIHAVDVDQVGLSGFGRRDNYCKRQVERWAAQYAASVNFPGAEPDPKMLSLINWLRAHVPEEDAGAAGPIKGLVHGDYRLDNLVFHPTEPRIIAVLDWELSTLGNQRSDLAYSCLPYIFPTKYRQLYALPKPLPRGIPSQAEFVQMYSSALRFPAPSPDQFVFYSAVSLFRAAAIFAGVYRRALQGNASSEHASKTGVLVEALAGIALDVIGSGSGGNSGRLREQDGAREISHAQQKYAPGGLPGVPTGHFGSELVAVGEVSHAQQKYAPISAQTRSSEANASEAGLSHAQQKYAPGGLPGVPTGHFGKEQDGVGEASHAQQKYAPVSSQTHSSEADAGLSHAQQKYAPGGLPGIPTERFGSEEKGTGEASHAQQKYAPSSGRDESSPTKGAEAERPALSHAQHKYAPGGLPGVPPGHFGKQQNGSGDATHAQQKYAPDSSENYSRQGNASGSAGGGLSHAQQKYAPGGLPGVPTGRFGKDENASGDATHAQQKYAPDNGGAYSRHENASGSADGGLSHAQQKYAPGGLPGVPTERFGKEQNESGNATHAQQRYAPDSASGSGKDDGDLSHAQQKYAPGGLPGVPTGHFGKEQTGSGEGTHAEQRYAPETAPGTSKKPSAERGSPGLSHAQQKCAPGGLPGVPTGHFEGSGGGESSSHADQRYSPVGLQRVPTSSNGGKTEGCHCKGGCGKATLGFGPSEKAKALRQKLEAFLTEHIYPIEPILDKHSKSDVRWTIHPLQEQLKEKARAQGLWNLWVPRESGESISRTLGLPRDSLLCGAGLTNLEYAHCCEVMGKSVWAPEVFNCSAPDTGNMEVLARYGTPEQQKQWLLPLLDGRIRSCFAMTEPDVASSDATNIESRIVKDSGGPETESGTYVLTGKKWWTSGAMDPRCQLAVFMGKTNPGLSKHRQQSMILVDMRSEGVKVIRPLTVFGFEDAPHGHAEVHFDSVKVPVGNLLLGEGRGFEIAQGRLGPGRLHHCMRLIGAAERAIELVVARSQARTTFGKKLSEHGGLKAEIAQCRIGIEQARLLVLNAAHQLDLHGNKEARVAIAIAKVVAPNAALKVLDRAIQVHGGGGVCSDFPLSHLWAAARTLRIADGPDEVHLETIGRAELARARL